MTPVQKMRVIDLCKKRKEIVEQKRREKALKQQQKEREKQSAEHPSQPDHPKDKS